MQTCSYDFAYLGWVFITDHFFCLLSKPAWRNSCRNTLAPGLSVLCRYWFFWPSNLRIPPRNSHSSLYLNQSNCFTILITQWHSGTKAAMIHPLLLNAFKHLIPPTILPYANRATFNYLKPLNAGVSYFSEKKRKKDSRWRLFRSESRKGLTTFPDLQESHSSTSVSSVLSRAMKNPIFSITWNTTCAKTPSPWCHRNQGRLPDRSRLWRRESQSSPRIVQAQWRRLRKVRRKTEQRRAKLRAEKKERMQMSGVRVLWRRTAWIWQGQAQLQRKKIRRAMKPSLCHARRPSPLSHPTVTLQMPLRHLFSTLRSHKPLLRLLTILAFTGVQFHHPSPWNHFHLQWSLNIQLISCPTVLCTRPTTSLEITVQMRQTLLLTRKSLIPRGP